MPLMSDNDVDGTPTKATHYGFSALNINSLGADSYTLFGMILDKSGSVFSFAKEIEEATQKIVKGCQSAPRADNMLVRMTAFNNRIDPVHDFKLLVDCAPDSYKDFIQPGGTTVLYDASVDIVNSVALAGKELLAKDYKVNGIVVIVTDGEDVGSTYVVSNVKAAIEAARRNECLESLLVILIGVNINDPKISASLRAFQTDAGIDQYLEIDKADPKTFAKVAGFVVESVSSQSQCVGTGSASKPIVF